MQNLRIRASSQEPISKITNNLAISANNIVNGVGGNNTQSTPSKDLNKTVDEAKFSESDGK